MHGSGFSCYFLLFFFLILRLFLFRAPWVVTADEGEGRRGANPRWKRVDPDSEPGILAEPEVCRCYLWARRPTARGSRCWPQPVPEAGKKKKREREMERREGARAVMQGAGRGWGGGAGAGSVRCALLRGGLRAPRVFHLLPSARRSSTLLRAPRPLSREGIAPLFLRPPLCRTSRILA